MSKTLPFLAALALAACARTAREPPASQPAPAAARPSEAFAEEIARFEVADLVRRYAATDPRLLYVDVFTPMLGPDGIPREELFVADRLHLNARGYALRDLLMPIVHHVAR